MAYKPLRLDSNPTNFSPLEADPANDYLAVKGFDFEDLGTHILDINGSGDMEFQDVNAGGPWTLSDLLGVDNLGAGRLYRIPVGVSGNVINRWTALYATIGSTDSIPFLNTFNSEIFGFFYINENDSSDIDIEIYKNGITVTELISTIQVRAKRYEWATNMTPLSLVPGDKIAIFLRDVADGTDPRNVIINLFIRNTDTTTSSGGSSTL